MTLGQMLQNVIGTDLSSRIHRQEPPAFTQGSHCVTLTRLPGDPDGPTPGGGEPGKAREDR